MDNQKTELSPHDAYIAMCTKMGIDPDTMKPVTDYDGCSDDEIELPISINDITIPKDHPEHIYNIHVLKRLIKLDIRDIKLTKLSLHRGIKKYGSKLTQNELNQLKEKKKKDIFRMKCNLRINKALLNYYEAWGFVDWRKKPFDFDPEKYIKTGTNFYHDKNARPYFYSDQFMNEYKHLNADKIAESG